MAVLTNDVASSMAQPSVLLATAVRVQSMTAPDLARSAARARVQDALPSCVNRQ